jgi:nicotinate-nucleotide adenylyltransferase
MRAAVLGGTFDPVHVGHLYLAEEALRSINYDRIFLIPAKEPPHKKESGRVTPEIRIRLLRKAVEGRKEFIVEDCELKRDGTSYTIDTVKYLLANYSIQGKLGLVIGDDLIGGFQDWRQVDELTEITELVVAKRNSRVKLDLSYPHTYLDNLIIPISSTEIRNRISERKPYRYLVPENVYAAIQNENLYADKNVPGR